MSRSAINMLNHDVMMDLVWRKVFGPVVEEGERAVLKAVAVADLLDEPCSAADITASVALILGVSRPTADIHVANAEIGPEKIVIWRWDQDDARRKFYELAPGIRAKLDLIEHFRQEVMAAWSRQCAAPDDAKAGKELLSDPLLYFNLADLTTREDYRQEISKKKEEHRSERRRGHVKEKREVEMPRQIMMSVALVAALAITILSGSAMADTAALFKPKTSQTTIDQIKQ